MKCCLSLAFSLWIPSAVAHKLRASDKEGDDPAFWETAQDKCASYTCSPGWVPDGEDYDIAGSSDLECCKKTCKLFTCGLGYKDNPAYGDNVGESDWDCCDKKCGLSLQEGMFNCTEGFSAADEVGVTGEECCAPKCALFKCGPLWAANHSARDVVAQSDEECCTSSCASVVCDGGYVHDDRKVDRPIENEDECCVASCALFPCPTISGSLHPYVVRPEKMTKQANSASDCCEPQCRHHNCSDGWIKDPTKSDLYDPTTEKCCMAVCSSHVCPHNWYPDTRKAGLVGNTKEECCMPSCLLYTECDADAGWANPGQDIPGNTHQACCEKTCFLKRCPNGYATAPHRNASLSQSEAYCCHNHECVDLQHAKDQLDGDHHCNGVQGEEACHKYYERFVVDNGTNVVYVACEYDAKYSLCRLSDEEISGCIDE